MLRSGRTRGLRAISTEKFLTVQLPTSSFFRTFFGIAILGLSSLLHYYFKPVIKGISPMIALHYMLTAGIRAWRCSFAVFRTMFKMCVIAIDIVMLPSVPREVDEFLLYNNNYWDFRAGRLSNHFLPMSLVYCTHRIIYIQWHGSISNSSHRSPGGGEGRMTGWRRESNP